jgi:hypothetical protein
VEEVAAVTYVMAAIGVAGVAALLWKALAPDDDPEFLRGLNGKRQQPNDES